MAWTGSQVFVAYLHDSLTRTAAFNPPADTVKAALFNNSITPSNTVSAANSAYNVSQWANTNELSNGGWSAGGIALTSDTMTNSSNLCTYTAANTANGSTSTMSNIFGCLIYDNTLASPVANQGICFNFFGGTNSVSAGVFTIAWGTAGIFTATCS